ncbi:hypothetical protein [Agrobacterium tumefaciens]|uniref:hypothetical protein n=1 Tax=Agrobacterium tumefaciens complex TaxID=1183400 RepID=UPI001659E04F|nr:hypothetical protein [Agrobacterium tumefaciens]QNP81834.1 hypothetical protein IAI05_17865 [Agrobacterium tumefaciens]
MLKLAGVFTAFVVVAITSWLVYQVLSKDNSGSRSQSLTDLFSEADAAPNENEKVKRYCALMAQEVKAGKLTGNITAGEILEKCSSFGYL